MLVLNEAAIRKSVRRRRTWYRRRLRFQRVLVAAVVGVLIAGACWRNAAHFFGLPTIHSSQILPAAFWVRTSFRPDRPFPAIQSGKFVKAVHRIPGVYPYSVVPGGVKTPDDLRYASLRDPVVRRHFSHFDFQHAQLIRVAETREVFLSYRIRDTVFWTRKTVRLHRGELLLTDGKITARARCGNQISDTAKPEVSDEEPDADVVDQPAIAALSGPPVSSPSHARNSRVAWGAARSACDFRRRLQLPVCAYGNAIVLANLFQRGHDRQRQVCAET